MVTTYSTVLSVGFRRPKISLLEIKGVSMRRTILPGIPATRLYGGTDSFTNVPAAISEFSPISTLQRIVAPAPM
jgi:hypothetical protein